MPSLTCNLVGSGPDMGQHVCEAAPRYHPSITDNSSVLNLDISPLRWPSIRNDLSHSDAPLPRFCQVSMKQNVYRHEQV